MPQSGNAHRRWLPTEDWKSIQESIPITCVDVLPIRLSRGAPSIIEAVGLILRDTPHQGRRWCLVGGRLLYGESVSEAIRRQIRETLGPRALPRLNVGDQPLYIAQYFPFAKKSFPIDPRQHSVGLTYALEIKGNLAPRGEAIDYEWFDPNKLPSSTHCGFNQDRVVRACIALLGAQYSAMS